MGRGQRLDWLRFAIRLRTCRNHFRRDPRGQTRQLCRASKLSPWKSGQRRRSFVGFSRQLHLDPRKSTRVGTPPTGRQPHESPGAHHRQHRTSARARFCHAAGQLPRRGGHRRFTPVGGSGRIVRRHHAHHRPAERRGTPRAFCGCDQAPRGQDAGRRHGRQHQCGKPGVCGSPRRKIGCPECPGGVGPQRTQRALQGHPDRAGRRARGQFILPTGQRPVRPSQQGTDHRHDPKAQARHQKRQIRGGRHGPRHRDERPCRGGAQVERPPRQSRPRRFLGVMVWALPA